MLQTIIVVKDGDIIFFFFKQKTAYEIGVRLVGSEMCIRDRSDILILRVKYSVCMNRLEDTKLN